MKTRWLRADADIKKKSLYQRIWLQSKEGKAYRKKHSMYAKEWRKKNPELKKAIQQRSYDKIRTECFNHYGGAICKCCGETEIRFLHLDHIDGDGAKQRHEWEKTKSTIYGGTQLYYWLKKNNYPPELKLQVLCANCNLGKRTNRYCPHELKKGIDMNGNAISKEYLPIPYPKPTRRSRGEAIAEAEKLGVKTATLRMRKWRVKHPKQITPKPEPTHCKNGHAYADNNLYFWKNHRQCRQCKRDYKIRKKLSN